MKSSGSPTTAGSLHHSKRGSTAENLGFQPITTPAYSSESNGVAEAFVNTLKRDYVGGADLTDADTIIRQLPAWIDDYSQNAPIRRSNRNHRESGAQRKHRL